MTAPRCASLCRRLGEAPYGTAPAGAGAWLLVEHPGPWPRGGLTPGVPAEVAAALEAGEVRAQLIRRPGRRSSSARLTVFAAWSRGGPDEVWVERRQVRDLRELGELDLAALAVGRRPGFGEPHDEALLLVCTHGRHDACCAKLGYPVAACLADRFGPAVWETSHVGGDRFAANLVCLPDGTYHGKLSVEEAPDVAAACLRGEVSPVHYRGRAGMAAVEQAAEALARWETGEAGVHAVRVLHRTEVQPGRHVTTLEAAGRRLELTLTARRAACPRLLSCAEGTIGAPFEYELVRIGPPNPLSTALGAPEPALTR